jgi:tetratricopeptide (TPR) repeat protein
MLLWIWSFSFLSASCRAQEPFADVVAKVKPSVVIVEGFFREDSIKFGTGFIITETGDVITNYHVIDACFSAKVILINGKIVEAKGIVAKDEKADLVRLALTDIDTTFDSLATCDTVRAGDVILVIGNPLRLGWSVSNGIVANEARYLGKLDAYFLQHTAPVYGGSSGSPLFNLKGEVIGIHARSDTTVENIHYAIPASKIESLQLQELVTLPEELIKKYPNLKESKEVQRALGLALYSYKNDYDSALTCLKEAKKYYKKDPELLFIIGDCYEKQNQIDSAIDAYEQAVFIKRDYFRAWWCLGYLYNKKERYPEAIKAYERARRIKSDDWITLFNLAGVYLSMNKASEALEISKSLIEVCPGYVACDCHVRLGESYFKLGRFEEAKKAIDSATTFDHEPSICCSRAYSALAELNDSLGLKDEANKSREKAEAIEPKIIFEPPKVEWRQPQGFIIPSNSLVMVKNSCPGYAEWAEAIGEYHESLGHHKEALQKYKEATETCSVYAAAYKHRVALYSKLGRYEEAVEVLKDALRVKDCFVWAYYRLVIIQSTLQLHSDSEEFLEKVEHDTQEPCEDLYGVELNAMDGTWKNHQEWARAIPSDTAFKCCALGVVCEIKGDNGEAMEMYKQATQIYPNFAEAHFLLGRAYVSLGDFVSALKELKILKELNEFLADKLLDLIYPP